MKRRTALQWLYCLTDPHIRNAAIRNYKRKTLLPEFTNSNFSKRRYIHFNSALMEAFTWNHNTNAEPNGFWSTIYHNHTAYITEKQL